MTVAEAEQLRGRTFVGAAVDELIIALKERDRYAARVALLERRLRVVDGAAQGAYDVNTPRVEDRVPGETIEGLNGRG